MTRPRFEHYITEKAIEWLEQLIEAMEDFGLRLKLKTYIEIQSALDNANFYELYSIIYDLENIIIEMDRNI